MRIIALAILGKGKIRDAGRIDLEHSRLLQFATKLKPDDEIVIERQAIQVRSSDCCRPLWAGWS